MMLTAHGDDETRRQSLEAGAVAFLEKPVRSPVLLEGGTDSARRDVMTVA
jgi:FixJ family two-component response regulator